MTNPPVPPEVDLSDFSFMPFEFDRLFQSETWVLSNDAEKIAALTLWGKSWREVPAGSLPNEDRMLAHLSGAGPRWKKLKEMALRGWKLADDGRLYHPVVCEKALEAWIEKLSARLKGGAGNKARWGTEFDEERLTAEIAAARAMLKALNPDSRTLRKAIPQGSKKSPTRIPSAIPQAIPQGSQETGTETIKATTKAEPPGSTLVARATPTDAGRACRAMRDAGCPPNQLNPSHPDLVAAIREGCTDADFADTVREGIARSPPVARVFAWAIATARGRLEESRNRTTHPGAAPHAARSEPRRVGLADR